MKNIIITTIALLCINTANAQLLVNSSGKVGIGSSATAPVSQFTVNTNGDSKYSAFIMEHSLIQHSL